MSENLEKPIKLTAMVAMTPDRVIGKDNDLPWHLPEDLQLFKRTTSGHPIVMGRKTWDSIGRPLPNRQNIVLTRNAEWQVDGAEVIGSPEQVGGLDLLDPHVFVIGGAQIYEFFLPMVDELLVSHVYQSYQGNTYFPEFEHLFAGYEVLQQFEEFEWRRYYK